MRVTYVHWQEKLFFQEEKNCFLDPKRLKSSFLKEKINPAIKSVYYIYSMLFVIATNNTFGCLY